jgi:uncharacterized protein YqjF (DUF2071 family)
MNLPTLEKRLSVRERPPRSPVMYQSWQHLLFLHWRWDAADIQRRLPTGLTVDTFDGSAWVAIVPFYMRNIRPRFLPPLPWISYCLEVNVRTYVYDELGRPGVWFFSLDCNQPVAVWAARSFFHLPYYHSKMSARAGEHGAIDYSCHRRSDSAASSFCYKISPATAPAEPGTLEFFLVERYLLFSATPGGIRAGQVHHCPYPLGQAEAPVFDIRLLALNGLQEPERNPDHVCGSPRVDVCIYPLA